MALCVALVLCVLGFVAGHVVAPPGVTRVQEFCDAAGNRVYTTQSGGVFVLKGCSGP